MHAVGLFAAAVCSAALCVADTIPVKEGCIITAQACLNFPEFSRTQFRDKMGEEHAEAGANEAACLKRAEDFHYWCGNNATGGAQVAATYGPKQWTQLYHPGACETGWSQWDAFCYKYFWEMKTWPDAESLCRHRDSHLVSIHSREENRFVAVLQHGLKGWIGYTDVDKDTHYEWSDNTQDDFTNFAKNCSGRENDPDCRREEVQQQWYSSSGASTSPYTCKRNALIPGLALLKNTSANKLTQNSWFLLMPALTVNGQGEMDIVAAAIDSIPSLKLQEFPKASSDGVGKGKAAPEPRFALPKGSFL